MNVVGSQKTIGTTDKTRAAIVVGQDSHASRPFVVARKAEKRGSRWVVLNRFETLEAAEAGFTSVLNLAGYWECSASESYFRSVEAGEVRTVVAA